jgi:hypothetical protein
LLATPQKAMNVAHFEKGGDGRKRAIIDGNLDGIFKSLPDEAKHSIKSFIHDIR